MAVMKNGEWHPTEDAENLSTTDTLDNLKGAEAGRYHLYVSYACPFAHRALLTHHLLGLDNVLSVSSVSPYQIDKGWAFDDLYPDSVNQTQLLHELFSLTQANYSGRVTVPVIWDKHTSKVVSHDSGDVAEWLATQWLSFADNPITLFPEDKQPEITDLCAWINDNINVAVYRAGFSPDQQFYEAETLALFKHLDELEERLGQQRYLMGNDVTLADVWLFPTLSRFDTIYYIHYKLNKKRLQDYPNLWGYLLDLMQTDAFNHSAHLDYSKHHYFYSQDYINVNKIIPIGPDIDWDSAQYKALIESRKSL